jgi:ABC-type phosphate transport system auxiliary subunit
VWDWIVRKSAKDVFFLKLSDGQEYYVDSDDGDFIGKDVYQVRSGEITTEPAPDGTHELAVGKTIVVQDGKVMELVNGDMEEELKQAPQSMEDECEEEETMETSTNMTEEEMEEKMKAMFETGMKELENKLTQMMTKQSEDFAEARKTELDKEYNDLKAQMRAVVTQFEIPANAGNHNEGKVKDDVLSNVTPENIRAFRDKLRAQKA